MVERRDIEVSLVLRLHLDLRESGFYFWQEQGILVFSTLPRTVWVPNDKMSSFLESKDAANVEQISHLHLMPRLIMRSCSSTFQYFVKALCLWTTLSAYAAI